MKPFTVRQAAALIPNALTGKPGISPTRVQQLIAAGRLPATMYGGRWFIREIDLKKFIEQNRRIGRPPVQAPAQSGE